MVFGGLLVTPAIREDWIGTEGHVLFTLPFFEQPSRPPSSSARLPASRRSRRCTTPWPRPSTPQVPGRVHRASARQLQETFVERGEYLELIAAWDRSVASRVG